MSRMRAGYPRGGGASTVTAAQALRISSAWRSATQTPQRLWNRISRAVSWPRLVRSQAFRIVLIYVVLFGLSATGLIAFTYWNAKRALDAQSDQIIEAETADLANQYRQLDE